ncbi:MAG: hypothetical protein DRP49_00965 [Spirochaetes bacterium]|nr:MAG: hypothetical protein DRP49_00965 [Spirochaetota bacterium]
MKKLYMPLCLLLLASCASDKETRSHSIEEIDKMVPCDTSEIENFHQYILYYMVEEDIENVWAAYTGESLDKFWNGPIARFSTMYNPKNNVIFHAGDSDIPEASAGQKLSLNLLIEGYIRIPVYFQIQRVDSELKVIEFVYMEQNKSHGKQLISFFPETIEGENFTLIRHQSWYQSDSAVRDSLFYSDYHTQAVDEFHLSVAGSKEYSIKPVTEKYLIRRGLFISLEER